MSKLKLNILVTYPYFSQEKKYKKFFREGLLDDDQYRIILDSGAYSVWNSPNNFPSIDIDKYCSFLDEWNFMKWRAVQLDVFGNPEQTKKNYRIFRERGYDVFPVFTRGDNLEFLEEIYNYTDYIMFGGIVIGGKNRNYVKWFHENNKGRKAHYLGFVNTKFLKAIKPYSCDSHSFMFCNKMGIFNYYDFQGNVPCFRYDQFRKKFDDKILFYLKKIGMKDKEIAYLLEKKENWKGSNKDILIGQYSIKDYHYKGINPFTFYSVVSHILRAIEFEKKCNVRIYFACTWCLNLEILLSAWYYIRDELWPKLEDQKRRLTQKL